MGKIHEAIRRLNEQPCAICSFEDRTERSFIAQTRYMEFPKPGTPEHEKIIVCDVCFKIVRVWELKKAAWEAEKVRDEIILPARRTWVTVVVPRDHQFYRREHE